MIGKLEFRNNNKTTNMRHSTVSLFYWHIHTSTFASTVKGPEETVDDIKRTALIQVNE